jgi:hypothetical protein
MYLEILMTNQTEKQPEPATAKKPSWFDLFTWGAVASLIFCFIRAIPLYFIWNLCLAQELHLQQLSYIFFVCAVAFLKTLLYSEQLNKIGFTMSTMSNQMNTLYNLMLWEISRQVINSGQVIEKKGVQLNEKAPEA